MPTITMYVPQSREQSLTSQNRWFYSAERAGKKANFIFYRKAFSVCKLVQTPREIVCKKVKNTFLKHNTDDISPCKSHWTLSHFAMLLTLTCRIMISDDEYRKLKTDVIKA